MSPETAEDNQYTRFQLAGLVGLRMAIGWHFLYEGIPKLLNPYWTAAGYLQASQGPFADWFLYLAADPTRLRMVDILNEWGLVLIGAALIIGVTPRLAPSLGAAMLLLYYLANPPLLGIESPFPSEGSYLFVNKVLIEILALLVVVGFPTNHLIGLGRLKLWERNHA